MYVMHDIHVWHMFLFSIPTQVYIFQPGINIATEVEIFKPGWTYLYPDWNINQGMKSRWKYSYRVGNWNKRPLGLTAPLSNNTLSIIHSPMNAQWPWFDLSMPPKVKCHRVNWNIIYDVLYVFHAKFNKMLHLGDIIFWKSCDLDVT